MRFAFSYSVIAGFLLVLTACSGGGSAPGAGSDSSGSLRGIKEYSSADVTLTGTVSFSGTAGGGVQTSSYSIPVGNTFFIGVTETGGVVNTAVETRFSFASTVTDCDTTIPGKQTICGFNLLANKFETTDVDGSGAYNPSRIVIGSGVTADGTNPVSLSVSGFSEVDILTDATFTDSEIGYLLLNREFHDEGGDTVIREYDTSVGEEPEHQIVRNAGTDDEYLEYTNEILQIIEAGPRMTLNITNSKVTTIGGSGGRFGHDEINLTNVYGLLGVPGGDAITTLERGGGVDVYLRRGNDRLTMINSFAGTIAASYGDDTIIMRQTQLGTIAVAGESSMFLSIDGGHGNDDIRITGSHSMGYITGGDGDDIIRLGADGATILTIIGGKGCNGPLARICGGPGEDILIISSLLSFAWDDRLGITNDTLLDGFTTDPAITHSLPTIDRRDGTSAGQNLYIDGGTNNIYLGPALDIGLEDTPTATQVWLGVEDAASTGTHVATRFVFTDSIPCGDWDYNVQICGGGATGMDTLNLTSKLTLEDHSLSFAGFSTVNIDSTRYTVFENSQMGTLNLQDDVNLFLKNVDISGTIGVTGTNNETIYLAGNSTTGYIKTDNGEDEGNDTLWLGLPSAQLATTITFTGEGTTCQGGGATLYYICGGWGSDSLGIGPNTVIKVPDTDAESGTKTLDTFLEIAAITYSFGRRIDLTATSTNDNIAIGSDSLLGPIEMGDGTDVLTLGNADETPVTILFTGRATTCNGGHNAYTSTGFYKYYICAGHGNHTLNFYPGLTVKHQTINGIQDVDLINIVNDRFYKTITSTGASDRLELNVSTFVNDFNLGGGNDILELGNTDGKEVSLIFKGSTICGTRSGTYRICGDSGEQNTVFFQPNMKLIDGDDGPNKGEEIKIWDALAGFYRTLSHFTDVDFVSSSLLNKIEMTADDNTLILGHKNSAGEFDGQELLLVFGGETTDCGETGGEYRICGGAGNDTLHFYHNVKLVDGGDDGAELHLYDVAHGFYRDVTQSTGNLTLGISTLLNSVTLNGNDAVLTLGKTDRLEDEVVTFIFGETGTNCGETPAPGKYHLCGNGTNNRLEFHNGLKLIDANGDPLELHKIIDGFYQTITGDATIDNVDDETISISTFIGNADLGAADDTLTLGSEETPITIIFGYETATDCDGNTGNYLGTGVEAFRIPYYLCGGFTDADDDSVNDETNILNFYANVTLKRVTAENELKIIDVRDIVHDFDTINMLGLTTLTATSGDDTSTITSTDFVATTNLFGGNDILTLGDPDGEEVVLTFPQDATDCAATPTTGAYDPDGTLKYYLCGGEGNNTLNFYPGLIVRNRFNPDADPLNLYDIAHGFYRTITGDTLDDKADIVTLSISTFLNTVDLKTATDTLTLGNSDGDEVTLVFGGATTDCGVPGGVFRFCSGDDNDVLNFYPNLKLIDGDNDGAELNLYDIAHGFYRTITGDTLDDEEDTVLLSISTFLNTVDLKTATDTLTLGNSNGDEVTLVFGGATTDCGVPGGVFRFCSGNNNDVLNFYPNLKLIDGDNDGAELNLYDIAHGFYRTITGDTETDKTDEVSLSISTFLKQIDLETDNDTLTLGDPNGGEVILVFGDTGTTDCNGGTDGYLLCGGLGTNKLIFYPNLKLVDGDGNPLELGEVTHGFFRDLGIGTGPSAASLNIPDSTLLGTIDGDTGDDILNLGRVDEQLTLIFGGGTCNGYLICGGADSGVGQSDRLNIRASAIRLLRVTDDGLVDITLDGITHGFETCGDGTTGATGRTAAGGCTLNPERLLRSTLLGNVRTIVARTLDDTFLLEEGGLLGEDELLAWINLKSGDDELTLGNSDETNLTLTFTGDATDCEGGFGDYGSTYRYYICGGFADADDDDVNDEANALNFYANVTLTNSEGDELELIDIIHGFYRAITGDSDTDTDDSVELPISTFLNRINLKTGDDTLTLGDPDGNEVTLIFGGDITTDCAGGTTGYRICGGTGDDESNKLEFHDGLNLVDSDGNTLDIGKIVHGFFRTIEGTAAGTGDTITVPFSTFLTRIHTFADDDSLTLGTVDKPLTLIFDYAGATTCAVNIQGDASTTTSLGNYHIDNFPYFICGGTGTNELEILASTLTLLRRDADNTLVEISLDDIALGWDIDTGEALVLRAFTGTAGSDSFTVSRDTRLLVINLFGSNDSLTLGNEEGGPVTLTFLGATTDCGEASGEYYICAGAGEDTLNFYSGLELIDADGNPLNIYDIAHGFYRNIVGDTVVDNKKDSVTLDISTFLRQIDLKTDDDTLTLGNADGSEVTLIFGGDTTTDCAGGTDGYLLCGGAGDDRLEFYPNLTLLDDSGTELELHKIAHGFFRDIAGTAGADTLLVPNSTFLSGIAAFAGIDIVTLGTTDKPLTLIFDNAGASDCDGDEGDYYICGGGDDDTLNVLASHLTLYKLTAGKTLVEMVLDNIINGFETVNKGTASLLRDLESTGGADSHTLLNGERLVAFNLGGGADNLTLGNPEGTITIITFVGDTKACGVPGGEYYICGGAGFDTLEFYPGLTLVDVNGNPLELHKIAHGFFRTIAGGAGTAADTLAVPTSTFLNRIDGRLGNDIINLGTAGEPLTLIFNYAEATNCDSDNDIYHATDRPYFICGGEESRDEDTLNILASTLTLLRLTSTNDIVEMVLDDITHGFEVCGTGVTRTIANSATVTESGCTLDEDFVPLAFRDITGTANSDIVSVPGADAADVNQYLGIIDLLGADDILTLGVSSGTQITLTFEGGGTDCAGGGGPYYICGGAGNNTLNFYPGLVLQNALGTPLELHKIVHGFYRTLEGDSGDDEITLDISTFLGNILLGNGDDTLILGNPHDDLTLIFGYDTAVDCGDVRPFGGIYDETDRPHYICGGAGDDTLIFHNNVLLKRVTATNTLANLNINDIAHGFTEIETLLVKLQEITGTSGADTITLNADSDLFVEDGFYQAIDLGGGPDTLTLGNADGSDFTFIFGGDPINCGVPDGEYYICGGAGTNNLEFYPGLTLRHENGTILELHQIAHGFFRNVLGTRGAVTVVSTLIPNSTFLGRIDGESDNDDITLGTADEPLTLIFNHATATNCTGNTGDYITTGGTPYPYYICGGEAEEGYNTLFVLASSLRLLRLVGDTLVAMNLADITHGFDDCDAGTTGASESLNTATNLSCTLAEERLPVTTLATGGRIYDTSARDKFEAPNTATLAVIDLGGSDDSLTLGNPDGTTPVTLTFTGEPSDCTGGTGSYYICGGTGTNRLEWYEGLTLTNTAGDTLELHQIAHGFFRNVDGTSLESNLVVANSTFLNRIHGLGGHNGVTLGTAEKPLTLLFSHETATTCTLNDDDNAPAAGSVGPYGEASDETNNPAFRYYICVGSSDLATLDLLASNIIVKRVTSTGLVDMNLADITFGVGDCGTGLVRTDDVPFFSGCAIEPKTLDADSAGTRGRERFMLTTADATLERAAIHLEGSNDDLLLGNADSATPVTLTFTGDATDCAGNTGTYDPDGTLKYYICGGTGTANKLEWDEGLVVKTGETILNIAAIAHGFFRIIEGNAAFNDLTVPKSTLLGRIHALGGEDSITLGTTGEPLTLVFDYTQATTCALNASDTASAAGSVGSYGTTSGTNTYSYFICADEGGDNETDMYLNASSLLLLTTSSDGTLVNIDLKDITFGFTTCVTGLAAGTRTGSCDLAYKTLTTTSTGSATRDRFDFSDTATTSSIMRGALDLGGGDDDLRLGNAGSTPITLTFTGEPISCPGATGTYYICGGEGNNKLEWHEGLVVQHTDGDVDNPAITPLALYKDTHGFYRRIEGTSGDDTLNVTASNRATTLIGQIHGLGGNDTINLGTSGETFTIIFDHAKATDCAGNIGNYNPSSSAANAPKYYICGGEGTDTLKVLTDMAITLKRFTGSALAAGDLMLERISHGFENCGGEATGSGGCTIADARRPVPGRRGEQTPPSPEGSSRSSTDNLKLANTPKEDDKNTPPASENNTLRELRATGFENVIFVFDLQLANSLIPAVQNLTRQMIENTPETSGIWTDKRNLYGEHTGIMQTSIAKELTGEASYDTNMQLTSQGVQSGWAGVSAHLLEGELSSGNTSYNVFGYGANMNMGFEAYGLEATFHAAGAWFDVDKQAHSKAVPDAVAEGSQLLVAGLVSMPFEVMDGVTFIPHASFYWQETDLTGEGFNYTADAVDSRAFGVNVLIGGAEFSAAYVEDGDISASSGGSQRFVAESAVVLGWEHDWAVSDAWRLVSSAEWKRALTTDRESGLVNFTATYSF